MYQLSTDETFHFELLRLLALADYGGVDVSEMLNATEIVPDDFEPWYRALNKRVQRVLEPRTFVPLTFTNMATGKLRSQQTACFDKAIALMDVPGHLKLLPADSFRVPLIYFPAVPAPADKREIKPRPTVVLGSGFDSSMKELYMQGVRFISHWHDEVVNPVFDFLESLLEVDMRFVALMGYSMGDVLAHHATAFEPQAKALFLIDGAYAMKSSGSGSELYREVTDGGGVGLTADSATPTSTR
ncbi:hypothetical protein F5Y16DRAFT_394505 [Xylariaceae sp. FL0255]|nr:hypothetical protein F5Y16DRAFT_394505 [Xylariaceae sp. FL0255]